MGIFDIFKSIQQNNSEALEDYNKANTLFESGDYQESLRSLSWGFRKDINFKPLYKLAENNLIKLGGQEEASLFSNALKSFNNFEPFNNLGTHFYNEGHYDLALPFLKKAVQINPSNNDTVHDLAIVYSRRFNIKEAIQVLEENNPKADFWNYWFLTKLRILNGQTHGIQSDINELFEVLNGESDKDTISIPLQKVNEIQEAYNRLNLIKKPKNHIRDWHFIQYGNIILDFFEDSDNYVAGGRYVASWGSNESIKEITTKLSYYLKQFAVTFNNVYYLNDRDSKIIGIVIGKELNIEAKEYSSKLNTENSLIVGANSTDFNGLDELQKITSRQVLFALNHFWLDSAQISPDICGFMTQTYFFPWNGGGLRVIDMDAEKREMEQIPPDTREETLIATDIYNLTSEKNKNEEDLAFYLKHNDYLKGIGDKVNEDRYNFMIESPIAGSYFG
jgi:tetratricopeptide (TPR) repeat protein